VARRPRARPALARVASRDHAVSRECDATRDALPNAAHNASDDVVVTPRDAMTISTIER